MDAGFTAIIGCGNPARCDDGAGLAVIALLSGMALPGNVALFDAGTDGMSVMYRARGAARLVIVDARAPEGAPGAIYRVPGNMLEAEPVHGAGLHAFRWDHALFVGRKLYGEAFPADVAVFLIEAQTLDFGIGLSAPVSTAAQSVANRIYADLPKRAALAQG